MCTVTYIPKEINQFILTSNRDENYTRKASSLVSKTVGKAQVLFPMDPKSGGSWIAVSASDRVACLLNGAFLKHKHAPPYAKSRGLVLLDYFRAAGIAEFISEYQFKGIEPFTIILFEIDRLMEFRWDGEKSYPLWLPLDQPHIWSSSTLYSKKVREQRASWFCNWLKLNKNPNISDLLSFHQYGGEKDQTNGFVMNRGNKVQTLSITGVEKKATSVIMHHHDLLKESQATKRIDLSSDELVEPC